MKPVYKIFFFISVFLVVVSIMVALVFGLPLGADFKGGSVMEIKFNGDRPGLADIKETIISVSGINDASVVFTESDGAIARFNEVNETMHQEVLTALSEKFGDVEEERFDSIGPLVGSELKSKSVTAIILVLLAIIIYIAFVFRRLSNVLSPWVMGLGAMGALVHDIIIPVGIFAILGKYIGIEINAIFIAAILTILGYSVSDTVVVYDRVRENILRFGSRDDFSLTVHKSVMQTLSRSINTTLTTILSLVAIYFFGGQTLKFFSLALIIGIVAGSYSSIFVAAPILIWLNKKHKAR
ncbi:MAG: protein translocase subunit SecF [bacterium]|nr:protein translocase subunit SecF [bacterium]